AEDRGHGARRLIAGSLHRLAPSRDEPERILERERACEDERRVLPQAEARRRLGRKLGAEGAGVQELEDGHRVKEDRRLAQARRREILSRTITADREEIDAEDLSAAIEDGPRARVALDQVRRHADFLRPLPRKEDGVGKARLRHRSTRLSFVPSGRLPANEVVAPGETGAERDEEDDLPSGDPTARDRLVERDGNRRRGRVPVTLEIEEDAFLGNGKLASDRLDD